MSGQLEARGSPAFRIYFGTGEGLAWPRASPAATSALARGSLIVAAYDGRSAVAEVIGLYTLAGQARGSKPARLALVMSGGMIDALASVEGRDRM